MNNPGQSPTGEVALTIVRHEISTKVKNKHLDRPKVDSCSTGLFLLNDIREDMGQTKNQNTPQVNFCSLLFNVHYSDQVGFDQLLIAIKRG